MILIKQFYIYFILIFYNQISPKYYCMRNRKLYNSIENLVHKKHQLESEYPIQYKSDKLNTHQKKIAIEKYCHQQMKKKKLIPKNLTSKIDNIMKNFQTLETYVNVEDLIQCINQIHSDQQKKKYMMNMSDQNSKMTKLNEKGLQNNHKQINKIQALLKKVQKHLQNQLASKQNQNDCSQNQNNYKQQLINKRYCKMNSFEQNQIIDGLIQHLEQKSSNINNKIHNKQEQIVFEQLKMIEQQRRLKPKNSNLNQSILKKSKISNKNSNLKKISNSKAHLKQPKQTTTSREWNYYSTINQGAMVRFNSEPDVGGCNTYPSKNYNINDPFSVICQIAENQNQLDEGVKNLNDSQNFYRNKKKRQMLKLARVYLHMILQNKHKKKWTGTASNKNRVNPQLKQKQINQTQSMEQPLKQQQQIQKDKRQINYKCRQDDQDGLLEYDTNNNAQIYRFPQNTQYRGQIKDSIKQILSSKQSENTILLDNDETEQISNIDKRSSLDINRKIGTYLGKQTSKLLIKQKKQTFNEMLDISSGMKLFRRHKSQKSSILMMLNDQQNLKIQPRNPQIRKRNRLNHLYKNNNNNNNNNNNKQDSNNQNKDYPSEKIYHKKQMSLNATPKKLTRNLFAHKCIKSEVAQHNKRYPEHKQNQISSALKQVGKFFMILDKNQQQIKKQLNQEIKNIEKIGLSRKNINNFDKTSQSTLTGNLAKKKTVILWEDDEKLEKVREALEKQENSQALKQSYRNRNRNIR